MMKDVQEVVRLHREGCANCAQAVLSVYGEYFGLAPEQARAVACGFGGGMGGMGGTCGAVTGAYMALGLTYDAADADSRTKVYGLVQELTRRFAARHGSVVCRELLGVDLATPEGKKAFRERDMLAAICLRLDASAAEILEELLANRLASTAKGRDSR